MAGIAAGGIGQTGNGAGARMAAAGGAFSPLARAQYAALAAMRWQAFRHGLRTTRGAFEAAASGLNYLVYGMVGLGISAGLGAGAYSMVSKGHFVLLPMLFWAVFLMWQMMPLVMASFQQQFDLTDLLRFPLGIASFYLLQLIFGVVDSSTLLGCLGSFGIWIGVTLADPRLFAFAAVVLAFFGIFNLLLSRAIFAWLDRWLAKRRTREIVSVLFLVSMLGLQFLNPAVRSNRRHRHAGQEASAQIGRGLILADEVQNWLPPGLAATAIGDGSHDRPAQALGLLGLMGLWGLSAGLILGVRLRAVHRGEYLSDAPKPLALRRPARVKASVGLASFGGSGPIAAIIHKDLLTVIRSLPVLFSLGSPLVMVIIFASLMRGSGQGAAFPLALPLCIAYALLGFTQLIYNNLGAEGMGIQLLLYSPTPMRTILLAKNVFHAILFCVIAVLAAGLGVFRLGWPAPVWVAVTGAWLVFALPAHLAAGNLFSLIMPHRLNLSRIGRQRGGQASALLGMLAQVGILGVGAVVAGLCTLYGNTWLATPILLVLAVSSCIVWLRVMRNSDSIALRRRDELIATLAKAD
jgi:ABC-2 type transport system permease protein